MTLQRNSALHPVRGYTRVVFPCQHPALCLLLLLLFFLLFAVSVSSPLQSSLSMTTCCVRGPSHTPSSLARDTHAASCHFYSLFIVTAAPLLFSLSPHCHTYANTPLPLCSCRFPSLPSFTLVFSSLYLTCSPLPLSFLFSSHFFSPLFFSLLSSSLVFSSHFFFSFLRVPTFTATQVPPQNSPFHKKTVLRQKMRRFNRTWCKCICLAALSGYPFRASLSSMINTVSNRD